MKARVAKTLCFYMTSVYKSPVARRFTAMNSCIFPAPYTKISEIYLLTDFPHPPYH